MYRQFYRDYQTGNNQKHNLKKIKKLMPSNNLFNDLNHINDTDYEVVNNCYGYASKCVSRLVNCYGKCDCSFKESNL